MKKLSLILISFFLTIAVSAIPVDPNFCENKEDGGYAHPTHCRAYYLCISKRTSVLMCTEGLLYDPDYDVCERPEFLKKPCAEFDK
ncbi:chitin binding peritrophin-A domain-containing protein [Sphingobacterium spiritivorum]|uniref:chitin binding peritrophin-A domain-containing protein n=1 Tax=Sphingobacterium spiritivorum TaxID=258 RepID=UPI003DA2109A